MSSSVRPLNKRVAVRRFEAKEKSAGGLYLPGAAKEPQAGGEVLAVGGEIDDIKVKDVVLFGKYAGVEVAVEGKNILILKYDDILAVLPKAKK